jgi:hypothetical protein
LQGKERSITSFFAAIHSSPQNKSRKIIHMQDTRLAQKFLLLRQQQTNSFNLPHRALKKSSFAPTRGLAVNLKLQAHDSRSLIDGEIAWKSSKQEL